MPAKKKSVSRNAAEDEFLDDVKIKKLIYVCQSCSHVTEKEADLRWQDGQMVCGCCGSTRVDVCAKK